MLSDAALTSDRKLPLLKSIGEIWTLLRKDWRALLQAILIPAVIMALAGATMEYEAKKYEAAKKQAKLTASATANQPAPAIGLLPAADKPLLPSADIAILLGSWLVMAIAYVIAQIRGFRYLLLGETRSQTLFGRRVWRYMGYNFLYVAGITASILLAVVVGIIMALVLRGADLKLFAFVIAGIIGFIMVLFVSMRLLLTFPAVATDHDTPMGTARDISKGYTLSMFGILLLVNLPVLLTNIALEMVVTLGLSHSMAEGAVTFIINVLFHLVGLLFYLATVSVITYRLGLSNHGSIASDGYAQALANSKDTLA